MSATDWSARFNALPYETRLIGAAMESRTRIQQLRIEKDRLKRRYDQSIKEIDLHILNCEAHLKTLEIE